MRYEIGMAVSGWAAVTVDADTLEEAEDEAVALVYFNPTLNEVHEVEVIDANEV